MSHASFARNESNGPHQLAVFSHVTIATLLPWQRTANTCGNLPVGLSSSTAHTPPVGAGGSSLPSDFKRDLAGLACGSRWAGARETRMSLCRVISRLTTTHTGGSREQVTVGKEFTYGGGNSVVNPHGLNSAFLYPAHTKTFIHGGALAALRHRG